MNTKKYKKNLNSKEIQYNLVSQLNKLCTKLDEKFDVNCGGCCYLAYCIAKLFEQHDIEFNIMVFDCDYDLEKFDNIAEITTAMSHYAIMLKNSSEDVINCDDYWFNYNYKNFEVTSNDILECYYESEGWCPQYDVKNNIKILSIIEEFFNEWENNLREEQTRSFCESQIYIL